MALPGLHYKKNDEYFTPIYAVYPIMKRLKPNSVVWCPFDKEDSAFVKVLSGNGFKVIYGHVETGEDFFEIRVPECDYIISNPPYSKKGEVLKRLYEIGIPFAMLINMQGIFDCKERFEMFRIHRVEMLWLYPRINFLPESGERRSGSAPFQSGYLCSGICENQVEFEYVSTEFKE